MDSSKTTSGQVPGAGVLDVTLRALCNQVLSRLGPAATGTDVVLRLGGSLSALMAEAGGLAQLRRLILVALVQKEQGSAEWGRLNDLFTSDERLRPHLGAMIPFGLSASLRLDLFSLVFSLLDASVPNDGQFVISDAAFNKALDQLHRFLASDHVVATWFGPIVGMQGPPDRYILCPGCEIIVASERDAEAMMRATRDAAWGLEPDRDPIDPLWSRDVRAFLRLSRAVPKLCAPYDASVDPHRMASHVRDALVIHKRGAVGLPVFKWGIDGFFPHYGPTLFPGIRPFEPSGLSYTLERTDVDHVKWLVEQLRACDREPGAGLSIGLHWFGLAQDARDLGDRLINLVTASEAVLMRGEFSNARVMAERAAVLLEHDVPARVRVLELFQKASSARNKLVHGEKRPGADGGLSNSRTLANLGPLIAELEDHIRRVIVTIMRLPPDKRPSEDSRLWLPLVLGPSRSGLPIP